MKNRIFVLASVLVAFVATFAAISPDSVFFINEPEVPQELQK